MMLTNKKVVVVGGTGGMGLATARLAAEQGAEVVIGSRSPEKVARTAAEIGHGAAGYAVDVGDEAAVAAFFERVGACDHLVATVGSVVSFAPFLTESVAAARARFETMFWGQYAVARYGAPRLRPGGSLTLTCGVAGHRPTKAFAPSACAGNAVEALARTLALELAPAIRVNAVRAGLVDTEIFGGSAEERAETLGGAGQSLPLGRVGQADEIARSFLYLMENAYSTGTVLTVDGGRMIG